MLPDKTKDEVREEIRYQTTAEFLESTPPNRLSHIADLSIRKTSRFNENVSLVMHKPEIQLHCEHENCNGLRFFRAKSDTPDTTNYLTSENYSFFYVTYRCSNCQQTIKTFSLAAKLDSEPQGKCFKFGEMPPYGPPVSPKLISLIGQDRDAFLKGRICENQGLGVGAFTYYRRVVENQKNSILGEIIKVAQKIGVTGDKIKILESAKAETQFSKALGMAKDAMPESLLIDGQSPIALLHSALSKGVHTLTDEQCLEFAGSVRVVLGELSDRLSQALKDEAELKKALSILMKK